MNKAAEIAIPKAATRNIDAIEAAILSELDWVECKVTHRFAKGMYIREIYMPAGTVITSKIHKTQHPFTISKGKAIVSINGQDGIELSAPHTGITEPWTRRVLYVLEDSIWTTYHRFNSITGDENNLSEEEKDKIVKKVEAKIIQKHKVLTNNNKNLLK